MTTYPHGDWRRYSSGGCRCDQCRSDWRAYSERRRKDQAYGRLPVNKRIPADRARTHLLTLRNQGMSIKTIAAATGVSFPVIERILTGAKVGIYTSSEAKILATHGPDLTLMRPGALVDATGTHRRLQALNVNGWSTNDLGHELGCTGANIATIMRDPAKVTATTALAVRDLYDRLWDAPPPARTGKALGARVRMTRAARARGWAPPLAWDEDTIDDPTAHPHTATPGTGTGVIHVDDIADFATWGLTRDQAAHRLNVRPDSIDTALTRADRLDLLDALNTNHPDATKCDHCGRVFTSEQALANHRTKTHTERTAA